MENVYLNNRMCSDYKNAACGLRLILLYSDSDTERLLPLLGKTQEKEKILCKKEFLK